MHAEWLESPPDPAPSPGTSLQPAVSNPGPLHGTLFSLGFPTIDLIWGRRLLNSQVCRFVVFLPARCFLFFFFFFFFNLLKMGVEMLAGSRDSLP